MTTYTAHPMTGFRIGRYINSLRSASKRDYAERYALWLKHGEEGLEPIYPHLSAMAAQAVRMNIRSIREGTQP